jgi:hypothetical protein
MEYCPETLEDRLIRWKCQSERVALSSITAVGQVATRKNYHQEQTAGDTEIVSAQTAEVEVVPEVDTERAAPPDIDWHPVLTIFLDITKGLRYIHSKGFVHRDLKPKNGIVPTTNKILMSMEQSCFPPEMTVGN